MSQEMNQSQTVESVNEILVELEEEKVEAPIEQQEEQKDSCVEKKAKKAKKPKMPRKEIMNFIREELQAAVLKETPQQQPQSQVAEPEKAQMKAAWKAARQQWNQYYRNQAKANGKEWNVDETQLEVKHWTEIIGGFLDNMDVNCTKKVARTDRKPKEKAKGLCNYMLGRAEIVSNPEIVHEIIAGAIAQHEIEVKNNTHWAWKEGCYLGLDSNVEQKDLPIEPVNIPVEQKVDAFETYKTTVPISVKKEAYGGLYEFNLRFHQPRGDVQGAPIPVKLNIDGAQKPEQKANTPEQSTFQAKGVQPCMRNKIQAPKK